MENFGINLENIIMKSDFILEQKRVWKKINLSLIKKLVRNNGMKIYNKLTPNYEVKYSLISNISFYKGSNINQWSNTCEHLSEIIKIHLLYSIINKKNVQYHIENKIQN